MVSVLDREKQVAQLVLTVHSVQYLVPATVEIVKNIFNNLNSLTERSTKWSLPFLAMVKNMTASRRFSIKQVELEHTVCSSSTCLHKLKSFRLILLLISSFCFIFSFGKELVLPIDYVNHPIVGTRYLAAPTFHNSIKQETIFSLNDSQFQIVAKIKGDSIYYSISHQNNLILELSFNNDSVRNWAKEQSYALHAKPFKCQGLNYFFIPGTKINYTDSVYNGYPCMISEGEIKAWSDSSTNTKIFVINNPTNTPKILVEEENKIHSTKYINGLHFKEYYQQGDSIPLMNNLFILKEIDWESSYLYLEPTSNIEQSTMVNGHVFEYLKPYFLQHDYLFIDFWGTWCRPCINSMPHIQHLHRIYGSKISFLSICYDSEKSKKQAQNLLEHYDIKWSTAFIPFDTTNSIIELMKIDTFPTLLLIHKSGKLIFRISGENNFNFVNSSLKEIYNE